MYDRVLDHLHHLNLVLLDKSQWRFRLEGTWMKLLPVGDLSACASHKYMFYSVWWGDCFTTQNVTEVGVHQSSHTKFQVYCILIYCHIRAVLNHKGTHTDLKKFSIFACFNVYCGILRVKRHCNNAVLFLFLKNNIFQLTDNYILSYVDKGDSF